MPGIDRQDAFIPDIRESQRFLSTLRPFKVMVIIATTAQAAIVSRLEGEKDQRFFHEIMAEGQDTQAMVRAVLADHREIPSQDILYVGENPADVKAVAETGVATCLLNPLGASMIALPAKRAGTWNIHHLGELRHIVAAQC